jgi:hypothetical protein
VHVYHYKKQRQFDWNLSHHSKTLLFPFIYIELAQMLEVVYNLAQAPSHQF